MKSDKSMFKHFVFTRWNRQDDQVTIYNNPAIKDPEDWMEHRVKLFNEITLPSVMLQTEMNFTWLLSFAEETPKDLIDYYASWPNVKIIYEYPQTWLRRQYGWVDYEAGESALLLDGDWIITTRLDNDDYIYPTFIEKIQAKFDEKFLLVDTDGRQWDLKTGDLYRRFIERDGREFDLKTGLFSGKSDLKTGQLHTVERKTCNSPFISLIEQVGAEWKSICQDPAERATGNKNLAKYPIKTVYFCSHGKMEWHFPAVKINEPLYRMVIHDRNVSNKIVGIKVDE